MKHGIAVMALACAAGCAHAQDRAEIERTPIVGNRELPKVLVIVPWKQPLPGVPSGKPLHSVLDEPLLPLDRAVFRRQIDYSLQLRQQLGAPARTAGPSAANTTNTTNAPTGDSR